MVLDDPIVYQRNAAAVIDLGVRVRRGRSVMTPRSEVVRKSTRYSISATPANSPRSRSTAAFAPNPDRVKTRVRELIDAEDKKAPLNDDQIAALLKKEGIEISRRTVAKYRQQLDISAARQRREY